jgi:hypothetical protein
VSDEVLESVSRALQLDEAEHAHVLDLIRASSHERRVRRSSTAQLIGPSIRRIVDARSWVGSSSAWCSASS